MSTTRVGVGCGKKKGGEVDLHQYVRVLRAHWFLILGAVVICTGAAAALAWTRTPVYSTATQLFVSTRPSSDQSELYAGALFSQQRMRSYAELVSGERVTEAVIDRLGLPYTVEELQPRIKATVPANTVLIDIAVEDPSPQQALAIAEALGVEFPRFVETLESSTSGGAGPVNVRVSEAPELPVAPVSPNKLLYLLLGAHLGLLLGIAGAVLLEGLKPRSDVGSRDRGGPVSDWAGRPQRTDDALTGGGEADEISEAAAGRRASRFR